MKKKVIKNRVKRAKIISYLCIVPTLVFTYFFFGYTSILSNVDSSVVDMIFRYFFTFFVSLFFYCLLIFGWWKSIRKRQDKYKVIRFLYHYNKCVEAFGVNDIKKVGTIYNNRIKGVKVDNVNLTSLKDNISFGYNIMSCNSSKEIKKPAKRYEN